MTLENKVLRNLAEPAVASGRHEFLVHDAESGWNVVLTVDRRDELSCLLWEVSLQHVGQARDAELADWANALASRTRTLTEHLNVIEIDTGRCEAMLRTNPVQRVDQKLYFEAIVQGTNGLTLRRYQVPREVGERRTQVSFALTNETVARLMGELAAA